jgi:peptidoglycan hydrolase CwlO-like protein
MTEIFNTIVAIFIVMLICAPLVMLTILVIRTSKPKAPINGKKLEQLEENDYTIVDDVNKGFSDVNAALTSINTSLDDFDKRLEDIETKLEKDERTVKGFASHK